MQPGDVPHRITLTDADICDACCWCSRRRRCACRCCSHAYRLPLNCSLQGTLSSPAAAPATSNSGEKMRKMAVSDRVDDMIEDMLGAWSNLRALRSLNCKKFQHGKEVPHRNLKFNPSNSICWHMLHHKNVMHMPHEEKTQYVGEVIQWRVVCGTAKSKHAWFDKGDVSKVINAGRYWHH
jgi:hypothetical protein